MGRARKYQVSVGLSSDLIDIIEKTIQDEGYVSRSQFLEDLIRENIFHRCVNCKIHKLLLENNIDIRHTEMPRTIDEANELIEIENSLQLGRKASARNHERILLDTIRDLESRSKESIKYANRIDIYNEMQNHNVDRGKVDNMIEKMVRDGTLMLPRGYDSIKSLR